MRRVPALRLAASASLLALAGCAEPGAPAAAGASAASPVPAGMPARIDTTNPDPGFARAASAAEAAGWAMADGDFLIDGAYAFETWSGESGAATFRDDRIAYAAAAGPDAFTRYVHMRDGSRPDRPTLLALSRPGSDRQTFLLPMIRGDEVLLVSIQNRDQWIRLERS